MNKVTFFVGGFPVVSETFVINQVGAMVEHGFDVQVVAEIPGKSGNFHPAVEKFNLLDRTKTAYSSLSKIDKLKDIFKAIFADVVSLNWKRLLWIMKAGTRGYMLGRCFSGIKGVIVCHFGPMGARIAKLQKEGIIRDCRVITIFHGYDMSVYEELVREFNNYQNLFKHGELMLPISSYWRDKLISLNCAEDKITVQRMGVNLSDFQFIPRYASKTETEIIQLVTVCRFVEKKGLPVLLKAVSQLPPNYMLTIVGDGPLECELKGLIKNLGILKRVRLTGAINSSQVAEILNTADAFVLPSITAKNGDMEGIPVALMEAMATGLIVFSTYHSGIPELIEDGVSGVLVEESDPNGLAIALVNTFEKMTKLERQSIADEALKVITEKYNSKRLNSELASLIRGMLE